MKYIPGVLFLMIIITFTAGVSAQFNYKKGFVITSANDTLFGLINDGGGIRNSAICRFKDDKERKVHKFHPDEIKAYRFIGDKYYEAKQLYIEDKTKWVFTEVLLKGKINLYYYWKGKTIKYYIEKDDSIYRGLLNANVYLNLQNDFSTVVYNYAYWVTLKLYRDTLDSLFKDCKNIHDKVKFVDYNHKSLINVSKYYVSQTCKGNKCITYEKDLFAMRQTFGVFSGIQFSKITFLESKINPDIVGSKPPVIISVPIGIFYNFPLSIITDKLSFQIEMIISSYNYSNFGDLSRASFIMGIRSTTLGIPLLIKYTIPMKKISPSVSFGKEFSFNLNSKVTRNYYEDQHLFKNQRGGWFGEVGVTYKLTRRLSVFSNFRFQRNYSLVIADSYANHYSYSGALDRNSYVERFKTFLGTIYVGIRY